MIKRLFDILFSGSVIILAIPLICISAIGIFFSSTGPVIHRAKRVGKDGKVFTMYKLRTMKVEAICSSNITSPEDSRVFAFGKLLRKIKLDELPQFFNILVGDMSIVGPRPESQVIVEKYYTPWMLETLSIRPGITSPGALYNYKMTDILIDPNNPEKSYVEKMLPAKLALERAYIERSNFLSDIEYIYHTIRAVITMILNKKVYIPRIDVDASRKWFTQDCIDIKS